MNIPAINAVSDWNPQLFRELKGRLKWKNLAIATAISLGAQLILLLTFLDKIPTRLSSYSRHYCLKIQDYKCLTDSAENPLINWQLWWFDIFLWLSFIGAFGLLLLGTYMLIGDLAKEERRGTLNFLRVSPRSTANIFSGKLLGVPIFLYLGILLALPLHLFAAMTANIALSQVLLFYLSTVAGCIFFYSAAMLFGLVSTWMGGFQSWLGSGFVASFLWFTTIRLDSYGDDAVWNNPFDWLNLFNPIQTQVYLLDSPPSALKHISDYFNLSDIQTLQWFSFPVGENVTGFSLLMVVNFALWTYWIWQGLSRRFPNPSATIFSKQQSYFLFACFQTTILGFTLQTPYHQHVSLEDWFSHQLMLVLILDALLFLGAIAILSPHRQTLQDWARYKLQRSPKKRRGKFSLDRDWIWGEKSPATVAIGLNLFFSCALLVPWILLWPSESNKTGALLGLLFYATMVLFWAVIAQLILLMKTPKRGIWAAGILFAVTVLPPMVLGLLSVKDYPAAWPWLLSSMSFLAVKNTEATSVMVSFALFGQALVLALSHLQLIGQLRHAGESASKALLTGKA
ncbi:hypothetical protein [Phormidium sp. CCY1219]|uniref:hypothetical protein n=1 Tax=Phormidium sp. CCY1219 TaxID=2886104 RepID=UPI002D1E9ED1|nr:hypothetical protein [Phormidium sp. CCY1219]MEB3826214.1 ABC transporter permease [Phormidium sp. CCY1219]